MLALAAVLKQVLAGVVIFYACITAVSDSARIQWAPADTVYIVSGNVYDIFFTELFESQVVIFPDGQFYAFSTHEELTVGVTAYVMAGYLEKHGRGIKDAIIIIHNHPRPGSFSSADKTNCRNFRSLGFTGDYAIYFPFSQKVELLPNTTSSTRKDN